MIVPTSWAVTNLFSFTLPVSAIDFDLGYLGDE